MAKATKCKYCDSVDIVKRGKRSFPACLEHFELYKQEVNEKKSSTFLKHFGSSHYFSSNKGKSHIKSYMKNKYGVENPSQSELIQNKRKKTNLEKYGTEYYLGSQDSMTKRTNTNILKYGHKNPFQSDIIKEKIKQTNLEKYGDENSSRNEIVKQKTLSTKREKYWNIFQIKIKNKKLIPLFDKDTYINNPDNLTFKCEKCNRIFTYNSTNPQRITCKCNNKKSKYEFEILDWIKKYVNPNSVFKNKRYLLEKRPQLELDIYLPDYNLGIDFHGLYWHSDLHKDKNYHQEKWKLFKENNINIIQIFENEWINKENIVKSIILSKMNIFNNRIYARETIVKEINNDDYRLFLEENHIQGPINSSIRLGLYFNNELVSILGVGKSRFKKDEIELHRFCNKLNTQVVGGFSKLLSYYKNNNKFNSLISYTDLRYFDGSGYIKNGFEIDSITNPNYFYFKIADNSNIYSRIEFQKHKLKDKLDVFDPEKTEYENMLNNDYNRIFDAGNYKLIMREN